MQTPSGPEGSSGSIRLGHREWAFEAILNITLKALLILKSHMNYQVLARKWRPSNFEEMVGQEHVVRSLTNALNQNRIHPAYLFTGTRGVGKTTLARILAKALSCEQGVSATPCDQCKNCQAISQGKFPDLFEIDAASHTKVEDMRELLSNADYTPIQGPFKIYIFDEVHMLSNPSFNALLKTLEEPPSHAIFCLATTEHKKVPDTIISRCQQYCLKPLPQEQIETHLSNILNKEQIAFETSALTPIAVAAKGSVRDALTLLDQLIAYSNKNLTTHDVCELLGTIETNYLLDLLEALKQQNGNQLMELTQKFSEKAIDFQQLLQSLASLIHQFTLMKIAPLATQNNEFKNNDRLIHLSQGFDLDTLQKYYQILISGQQELCLSPTPKMGTDMTLLRMLSVNLIKVLKQGAVSKKLVEESPPPPKPLPIESPSESYDQDDQIKEIMKAFNAKLLQEK